MQRITGVSVAADLFGAGKDGFTEGSPGATQPTVVTADWLNDVQEEIVNAIEGAGLTLASATRDQLATALAAMRNTTLGETIFSTFTARTASARILTAGGTADLRGCAFGSSGTRSIFVAVGASGEIRSSPNAYVWSSETAAGSYSGTFYAVCYGGGLFVAVGGSGEIQTSPDGTTWTHRTAAGSYSGTFYGATYDSAAGLFVAVGSSGEIQTSPDGTTWTHRTAAGSYSGIFYGAHSGEALQSDGTFATEIVLCGASGPTLQYSADGTTWSAGSLLDTGTSGLSDPTAVCFLGTAIVAVAVTTTDGVSEILISASGANTFTRMPLDCSDSLRAFAVTDDSTARALLQNGALHVAVGGASSVAVI